MKSIPKKIAVFFLLFISSVIYGKNIAIVTISAGDAYREATFQGIVSKQEYCNKHGYDFICYNEILDPLRHPAWSKIKAIQKELEKYDWVFWSDADSIIMNSNIKLENFIDENFNFIICYDNVSNCINSGQFLIKSCSWSFDFLDEVYSMTEYLNHPWWENAAIISRYQGDALTSSHFKVLPQKTMNSFAYEVCGNNYPALFSRGDFIIHFPGIRDLNTLKYLMNKYYRLRNRRGFDLNEK